MRWSDRQESQNVEDRRRQKQRTRTAGGIGLGTIIALGLALFFGGDVGSILQDVVSQPSQTPTYQETSTPADPNSPEEILARFVKVVLKDTEDVWNKLFPEQLGRRYQEPVLVLYSGRVQSACGMATSASGPFYCPADYKLYLDLSFYNEVKNKFRVSGDADFALAYIVAHEVGHHVQNLLGITTEVQRKRRQLPEKEYNKLSVRLELQADFLAGVWAHHAQKMYNLIEEGDVQEAMEAAHAVGDDRIQKAARGYVVPDSFTHGTSDQRVRWFMKGLKTGDLQQGDTFAARQL